jgi:predicted RecA/RadA family phage recombinase
MFKIPARTVIIVGVLAGAISAAGNTGIVKKVHRGDLVQFGDTFVASLTGVKAPERSEALGLEIFDFTKRQLEGQTVVLITWTTDNMKAGIVHDDQGYPFVRIYYGRRASVCFNEVLLKKG